METTSDHEREVRAARNQALFRAVNEKLHDLNEAFESVTETFVIACECADTLCIEMVPIKHEEYDAVRGHPRRFAVIRDHVLPDIERVIREQDGYVVVEKDALAGEVAEQIA